jgi:hypothetical protein
MPWYAYHRGGWQIAVNATSQRDAAQHIKRSAPGATFDGEMFTLPTWDNPSMATAMITAKMQEIISAEFRREMQGL